MKTKNKYGTLSGGYIFDFMDRKAHKYANDLMGAECVTGSANIRYRIPLKRLSNKCLVQTYCDKTENKIKIKAKLIYDTGTDEEIVFVEANFIFVKK